MWNGNLRTGTRRTEKAVGYVGQTEHQEPRRARFEKARDEF